MEETPDPGTVFFETTPKTEIIGARIALLLELEDGRNCTATFDFTVGDQSKALAMFSSLISSGKRTDLRMPGMEDEP